MQSHPLVPTSLQAKDETLGHMVMAAIEITGYKTMADFWGLQRWRQNSKKSKLRNMADADKPQTESTTGNSGTRRSLLIPPKSLEALSCRRGRVCNLTGAAPDETRDHDCA